jgi:prophage regulatory protein
VDTDQQEQPRASVKRRFIGLPAVKARTSLSASTIERAIKRGEFPKPFRLTSNRIGWDEAAIEAWCAGRAEVQV